MTEQCFVQEMQGEKPLPEESLDSNFTEKIIVREQSETSATLTRS